MENINEVIQISNTEESTQDNQTAPMDNLIEEVHVHQTSNEVDASNEIPKNHALSDQLLEDAQVHKENSERHDARDELTEYQSEHTSGESLSAQRSLMPQSDEEIDNVRGLLTKRRKRIADSDDENTNILENDGEIGSEVNQSLVKHTRLKDLIDSDSDGDIEDNSVHNLINSDSDQDASDSKYRKQKKFHKKKTKFYGLIDDDDSDQEEIKEQDKKEDPNNSKIKVPKISKLIDSDSSSETNNEDEDSSTVSNPKPNNESISADEELQRKIKPKTMRASAKKAIDEMQAIQSEQQRLHREAHISIPYHKPKRYTLQEFLQRRTIQKTQLSSGGRSTDITKQPKSLKMTAEELEAYAKLMEEREKEAEEFFKSSDSDGDELKDNNLIEENQSTEDKQFVEENQELEANLNVEKNQLSEANLSAEKNQLSEENLMIEENQLTEVNQISEEKLLFVKNHLTDYDQEIGQIPMIENNQLIKKDQFIEENQMTEENQFVEKSQLAEGNHFTNKNEFTEDGLVEKTQLTKENHLFEDNQLIKENQLIEKNKLTDTEYQSKLNKETEIIEPNTLKTKDLFSESLTNTGNISKEPQEIQTSQPIITEVVELPKVDISTLKMAPPTTTEKVIRLIHEKNLPVSPSLKGDANMLIDLETGDLVAKKPTGVDTLLQRFLAAKVKQKPKTTETLSILSTENGKLEISNVSINLADDSAIKTEPKPGAAYFKLKENLRSIITSKRREGLQKKKAEKQEEELEHDKCFDDDEEELDEEDEYDFKTKRIAIDDEENALDMDEQLEDLEDQDDEDESDEKSDAERSSAEKNYLKENKIDYCNDNVDDENSEQDNDDDVDDNGDDDNNEESNDDDDGSINSNIQRNGEEFKTLNCDKKRTRIINVFQEDSDEENDLLRTPTQANLDLKKLSDDENISRINPTDEENELLGLCSGKFEETQQETGRCFISQIPVTQVDASQQPDADIEMLGLCSGTFDTQKSVTPGKTISSDTQLVSQKFTKKILSSDEENSINASKNDVQVKRVKKLTKRAKKNKAKLGFSDDEVDEVEEAAAVEEEPGVEKNHDDEEPETFVDYDSEENEIVVQMTKEECVRQAEKFFEKEAELSESDWGSADEDERNLDRYDMELGDEDEFDRAKLQAELGQIHARKMLDEDIREVRKLQEMLLEDEEADGVGRQRQFRWRNLENGFALNDPNGDVDNGENGPSDDEENEQMWRKIRYEREQLLKEQTMKEDISVTSILNSPLSETNTSIASSTIVKKLNIITSKKITSVEAKTSSPFLISKNTTVNNKKPVRGSFLVRDKETLSKLAGLTKGAALDATGRTSTVSVKDAKPHNFVFATLTEEEHASLKRKSDDPSSSVQGINFMKKPKMEPRRNKCLIDQLL